jgi:hypothetical protein
MAVVRGKVITAAPFCLLSSVVYIDKGKWWLSGNRTAGLFFESLACAVECFADLTK